MELVIMIKDIVSLSRRLVRAQLKRPMYIFLSVSQPLVYLIVFGTMFSEVQGLKLGGQSYISYLTPGMVIMTALFGSVYLSVGTLTDIERSLFDSIIISPVSRISISMSYVCANLIPVIIQMTAIIFCGVLMGGYPAGGMAGLFSIMLIGLVISIGFGCFSNTIGFLIKKAQNVMSLMNFIVMPLIFLSSMMLNIESMPAWMHQVVIYNPVHWGVVASQAAYAGDWVNNNAYFFLIAIIVFTVLMMGTMHFTFLRYLSRR